MTPSPGAVGPASRQGGAMLTLLRLPFYPVSRLANGFTSFSPYALFISGFASRFAVNACGHLHQDKSRTAYMVIQLRPTRVMRDNDLCETSNVQGKEP
jgi:hypothetical protein